METVLSYPLPGEDKDGDGIIIYFTWRGQRWRRYYRILYLDRTNMETVLSYPYLDRTKMEPVLSYPYLERTKMETVLVYLLPGQDKDGDGIPDES